MIAAAVFAVVWTAPTPADPPPWAPAHGYREKGKGPKGKKRVKYYIGYSGSEYERDFDILRGRCNRALVGAVIGGVVGGVIGHEVADRDQRTIATILGATLGALVGHRIGRDMDERDRACWGHALELAATGQRITWSNDATRIRYELVARDGGRGDRPVCRDFTLVELRGKERLQANGRACQIQPGQWEIVG
ncbi:MAG: glycine zipper 2TM domain-containing protein [Steroidobacteraceae bacterium]|nr:glycine zipper 2TM domain-containing protein [Steroidobacteraceae bacterium]